MRAPRRPSNRSALTDQVLDPFFARSGTSLLGPFPYALLRASSSNTRLLGVQYRHALHAECAFPGALQDGFAAWLYLVRECAFAPENIVVVGDSAGAGLSWSLTAYLGIVDPTLALGVPGKVALFSVSSALASKRTMLARLTPRTLDLSSSRGSTCRSRTPASATTSVSTCSTSRRSRRRATATRRTSTACPLSRRTTRPSPCAQRQICSASRASVTCATPTRSSRPRPSSTCAAQRRRPLRRPRSRSSSARSQRGARAS